MKSHKIHLVMKLHCFRVTTVFKWLHEAQLSQRDCATAACQFWPNITLKNSILCTLQAEML